MNELKLGCVVRTQLRTLTKGQGIPACGPLHIGHGTVEGGIGRAAHVNSSRLTYSSMFTHVPLVFWLKEGGTPSKLRSSSTPTRGSMSLSTEGGYPMLGNSCMSLLCNSSRSSVSDGEGIECTRRRTGRVGSPQTHGLYKDGSLLSSLLDTVGGMRRIDQRLYTSDRPLTWFPDSPHRSRCTYPVSEACIGFAKDENGHLVYRDSFVRSVQVHETMCKLT